MTGTLHFPGDVGGDLDRLLTLIETAHEHGDETAIVEQAAKVRAALTPSALSGDAGEGEALAMACETILTLRKEVEAAQREGAAMWRCGVSDTIILVDRVRRIFERERGLKRNRALANLDAELEIALQDWFAHSRASRPNTYNDADAAFKDFSAKSHLRAALATEAE